MATVLGDCVFGTMGLGFCSVVAYGHSLLTVQVYLSLPFDCIEREILRLALFIGKSRSKPEFVLKILNGLLEIKAIKIAPSELFCEASNNFSCPLYTQ